MDVAAQMSMTLKILPPIGEILVDPDVQDSLQELAGEYRTRLARRVLAGFRDKLRTQPDAWSNRADLAAAIAAAIRGEVRELLKPFPQRVINGTGVILHTNLGRAPLGTSLAQLDLEALAGYSNLEWDATRQKRSNRDKHLRGLLGMLTGAESALAVNNCASALLLALNTIAVNRIVLVSRGELVEIGGGFRIPEIMEASGCHLVEVGTTNKTRIQDYEKHARARDSVVLKVHQSNFVQRGYVESVSLAELAALGRRIRVPVIYDSGSGLLASAALPFLQNEPTVAKSVKDGASVVTFSGDKLLGSIQAGLIVGKSAVIEAMSKNPLYRALRVDKVRLALLHYSLKEHLAGRFNKLAAWEMCCSGRLEDLKTRLRLPANGVTWVKLKAETGGGSNPESGIESLGLQMVHSKYSASQLKERFASRAIPVIGYIQRGMFLLDVRTLFPNDFEPVQRVLDELWT
jgi:L-seryl-tRNA(Ser) seleniumtransferase